MPSMETVADKISGLGAKAIAYLGPDVLQMCVGVGLVLLAIRLASRAAGKLAFFLMMGALYLFSRGLLNMGTLLDWWNQLPALVEKFFLLGRYIP